MVAGVGVVARSRETYTRTGRPMVAGVVVVARSRETYTRTGRPMVAGVVVVARSRETYTRTGRPIVAGVAFVIEELRDLYVYWESYCMDIYNFYYSRTPPYGHLSITDSLLCPDKILTHLL